MSKKALVKQIVFWSIGITGIVLLIINMVMVDVTWSDIYHRSWELNQLGIIGLALEVIFLIWSYIDK